MRVSSSVLALFLASFAAASPLVLRGGRDGYELGNYGDFDNGYGGGHGGIGGGRGGEGGGRGGEGGGRGGEGGGRGGEGGGRGGEGGGRGGNGGGDGGRGGNGGGDGGRGGNGGGNGGNGGGNGGNGGGNGGNGGGNGGNGGGNGGKNACGVSPDQISALTPLLNKLGLSTTVDGVKQLVDKLLLSTGGLLESPGINGRGGLIDLVNNLVKGLLGQPLDLHNTVDAVTSILENQVPCLLDTVLPKP
ncbi:hypothetical protein IWW38_000352 [Coemansia aciculifera]|uniref:Uncharacterized protein n=1 Tax=Coemansia aciculifera TaxID=417176 RepID=A0ACC1MB95_9FUNG|nr:hypothetical protein IWW38_000352 [Coemansia aciculifera]